MTQYSKIHSYVARGKNWCAGMIDFIIKVALNDWWFDIAVVSMFMFTHLALKLVIYSTLIFLHKKI